MNAIGVKGAIILALLGFYEGLPNINQTVFLRFVPIAGPTLDYVISGRVGRSYQDGVRDERAEWLKQAEKNRLQAETNRRAAEERIRLQETIHQGQLADANQALSDLQQIISEEQANETNVVSARDRALAERLRGALNAIGK